MRRRIAGAMLAGLAVCLLCGCVERKIVVTSEPPGADVLINQTWQGKTPFTLPIKHNGVYDIRLEHEGYYPLYVAEPVAAKWHSQPGVDLVAEAVYPGTIRDIRKFHYVLEKMEEPDPVEEIVARQQELANRIQAISAEREKRDESRRITPLPLPKKKENEDAPESAPASEETDAAAPAVPVTDEPAEAEALRPAVEGPELE